MSDEPMIVAAAGARLGVKLEGSGPPVVLLHGFPQTSREWRDLVPRLADRYTTVTPDLRGFGRSDNHSQRQISREVLAQDVLAVIDHLELERVSLVGHDWGGIAAHAFAMRHPDRVASMTMMDTAITHLLLKAAPHFIWFQAPDLAEKAFSAQETQHFLETLLDTYSGPGFVFTDDDRDVYLGQFIDEQRWLTAISYYRDAARLHHLGPPGAVLHTLTGSEALSLWHTERDHPMWSQVMTFAHDDVERRSDLPAQWIYGTALGSPGRRVRAQFVRAYPRLEEHPFPTGHWIPDEAPELTATVVLDFLARHVRS